MNLLSPSTVASLSRCFCFMTVVAVTRATSCRIALLKGI